MKKYEVFTIFPGTLTDEEVKPAVEKLTALLGSHGAGNIEAHSRGKLRLAYPIRHMRFGHCFNFFFEAEPGVIPALRKKLRIEEGVLRALMRTFTPRQKPRMIERMRPALPKEERITKPPVAIPVQEKEKVSMEEIDEKLEKLLKEDLKIDV